MRRTLLLLFVFFVLCGFKAFIDGGLIIDRWYFDDDSQLTSTSGIEVSISNASPSAVMIAEYDSETEPFFVIPSANDTEVGPYGLYTVPAVDNLVQRASFKTCDGGSHPLGWGLDEYQDTEMECSTVHKAQGSNSLEVIVTNTPSAARAFAACVEVDNTEDYILTAWVYGHSDDENWTLGFYEFSATDCTGLLVAGGHIESSVDLPAEWSKRGGLMQAASWHASTQSVRVAIQLLGHPRTGDTTLYVDEVNFFQASEDVDSSCTCDTDATCSCSAIIPSIPTKITAGTWQFEATVRSPIDGAIATPMRQIIHIPETAATDKNRVDLYWASDTLTFDVYTSDGVKKTATVAAAGDADTSYTVKAYHTDTGRIGVCWDGSCGTETTGALTITPNTTTYLGSTDTTPGNIWVDDLVWSRGLTEPLGTP